MLAMQNLLSAISRQLSVTSHRCHPEQREGSMHSAFTTTTARKIKKAKG
jgi:hypothetical protein